MGLFKGIIFGIDGTLIDSNRAHARAWSKAFRQWSIPVEQAEVRTFIGMHPEQLVRKILSGSNYHYSKIFQLIESHDRIFLNEEARSVRPLAGARDLVTKLADVGAAIDIASGAPAREIDMMLKAAGVRDYFTGEIENPGRVISSNTENLELAAHRMSLSPHECILIGSSPYDIEAASRLRMPCIALRSGGWNPQALRDSKVIYDDCEDLWFRFNTSCLRDTYLALKAVKKAKLPPMAKRISPQLSPQKAAYL